MNIMDKVKTQKLMEKYLPTMDSISKTAMKDFYEDFGEWYEYTEAVDKYYNTFINELKELTFQLSLFNKMSHNVKEFCEHEDMDFLVWENYIQSKMFFLDLNYDLFKKQLDEFKEIINSIPTVENSSLTDEEVSTMDFLS